MTTFDRIERRMPVLLDELVVAQRPDYLDSILGQTERTSQRPGWTFIERWLPMSALTERLAPAPRLPWRTIGAVALIVLALVAGAILIVGNQPRKLPAPFGPAANGQIAYAADGDIFTADPTTGDSRALVTGPGIDTDPVYSRDGTKIAFTRTVAGGQREVYTADVDGGAAVLVTTEPISSVSGYEFSPDGTTIAIASMATEPLEPDSPVVVLQERISLANVDGSGLRSLGIEGPARAPSFRPPDGREIAFEGGSPSEGEGIFAYDLEAGSLRTIVEPTAGFEVTGGPSFSPDGSKIAYGWWGSAAGPNSRLYVIDTDGAGAPLLVEPPVSNLLCCEGGQIAWSNDGTRLAHFRIYDDGGVVAITRWDTGGTGIELKSPAMDDASLTWSPDDRYLLVRPTDAAESALEQVLFDAQHGATVPTAWTTTSTPSWQRVAIK